MDTPYHIEEKRTVTRAGERTVTQYAITRAGEDDLCWGEDVVFMHRLIDLLNADEHHVEGR